MEPEIILDSINQIAQFENSNPVRFLTNEALVLNLIKKEPGQPVKYYLSKSGLSYRGFYNIFEKLLRNDLIKCQVLEKDHRIKLVY